MKPSELEYYNDPNCPFKYSQNLIEITKQTKCDIKSEYVSMRDGVKLAVSHCSTINGAHNRNKPVILSMTRYWRDIQFRKFIEIFTGKHPRMKFLAKAFGSRGYVYVNVDCRGTGASFGSRPYPFHAEEILDGKDIMDWIIQQPWSNGKIYAFGGSYVGTMAEHLAGLNHPALKGIFPLHCLFDTFTENAFPGGIYDRGFIQTWENLCRRLDQNRATNFLLSLVVKGVYPVQSDKKRILLSQAIKEHSNNRYSHELIHNLQHRDDIFGVNGKFSFISVFSKQREIENSGIPIYYVCSWYDSGYGDGSFKRFGYFTNPGIYIVGDWSHGLGEAANPYQPSKKKPIPAKTLKDSTIIFIHNMIDFIESEIPDLPKDKKLLYYFTIGENKWKIVEQWPPANSVHLRFHFSEKHQLSKNQPENELGSDLYEVDYSTTTGKQNRWYTLIGSSVNYSSRKRNKQDNHTLIYTSGPLEKDLKITGNPSVSVYLSTTGDDGAIFAYLEDISPSGKITYLTDGQLRFLHRKLSDNVLPFNHSIPSHSYLKIDTLPVIPGEIMELTFGLLPISAVIKKGHKIRVSICGADKDTFDRYPKFGGAVWTIQRNRKFLSFVELPVVE